MFAIILLASLGPPMLGMSRAKLAPHWMTLVVAICRCSPKLSLRSNCTPRYLILFFHTTSCFPRTISKIPKIRIFLEFDEVNRTLEKNKVLNKFNFFYWTLIILIIHEIYYRNAQNIKQ